MKKFLLLATLTLSSGCATIPAIEVFDECSWVRAIEWNQEEGVAIARVAPRVARQLLAHNDKVKALCDEE